MLCGETFLKTECCEEGSFCTQIKGKQIPLQAWTGPEGFQEFKTSRFQDNRHMKVLSLSALYTGRFYLPSNIPGTDFC